MTAATTTCVGEFVCESGVLRVTDPCYSKGTWCAGTIPNCRTGKWTAEIHLQHSTDWGTRVARLTVTHDAGGTGPDETADFDVGVDSGQAGVFDDSRYREDTEGADFYDECCAATLSRAKAGSCKFGAVSSSGYGDGSYTATFRRDADGQCFYVSIEFIEG